jgi:hypothetical protein
MLPCRPAASIRAQSSPRPPSNLAKSRSVVGRQCRPTHTQAGLESVAHHARLHGAPPGPAVRQRLAWLRLLGVADLPGALKRLKLPPSYRRESGHSALVHLVQVVWPASSRRQLASHRAMMCLRGRPTSPGPPPIPIRTVVPTAYRRDRVPRGGLEASGPRVSVGRAVPFRSLERLLELCWRHTGQTLCVDGGWVRPEDPVTRAVLVRPTPP